MKKWSVALLCCLFLIQSVPQSSHAYEYGANPKWGTANFSWNYKDLKSEYRDNFAAAKTYWDETSTPLNFSQIADQYVNTARIRVKGSSLGNVGYNAIVHHYHASNYDTITANYSVMDPRSGDSLADENWITGVFGHELGHTFGLDHVTNQTQIMCTAGDGRKVYKPGSDDIAGINYLY
jgi:hypothetical protein